MLAFPVEGACWIFMEGWTEGGFFFFNVFHVSQNRQAERKSRCLMRDSWVIFVLVEDLISCTYGCTHEDHCHYFFKISYVLGLTLDSSHCSWRRQKVWSWEKSQGTPKENPGKFAFDIVHICLYIKLIREIRMRWVDNKTDDETRFDKKNVRVYIFPGILQHTPTFTRWNNVFTRTSANLNEIHEH